MEDAETTPAMMEDLVREEICHRRSICADLAGEESKDILVGGKSDAWKVPNSKSDSLNKWAKKSQFRVGDSLATMPSLQTALPPELANNVIRLYRECLRRAKFIGHQNHNTELLIGMVRQQFKRNMLETDPEKIQKMKDEAARGLLNHMLFEAEKTAGRKFSQQS